MSTVVIPIQTQLLTLLNNISIQNTCISHKFSLLSLQGSYMQRTKLADVRHQSSSHFI